MSDFYKYFQENMDALGLPAPESLFGTASAAVAIYARKQASSTPYHLRMRTFA